MLPISYSIGEVAAATGMSVHALRFYERNDLLLSPVPRSAGGRRVYSQRDVDWLHVCTRLRSSGMPLRELRRFVDLVRDGAGNEAARLELLETHQERVEAQLRDLDDARGVIAEKVTVYRDHLDDGTAGGLWEP